MVIYKEIARGLLLLEKERDPALGCDGVLDPAVVRRVAQGRAMADWAGGSRESPAEATQKEYDRLISALRGIGDNSA